MRHGRCGLGLFLVLAFGSVQSPVARELDILLANDDGFEAPGLAALRESLQAVGHRVVVVAPRIDQSGSSAKISTTQMSFKEEAPDVWVIDGSPADAVWVGLHRVFKNAPPDLVVSGANRGQNLGAVINLSGTVGAAVMAAMNDVPAIAVSVGIDFNEASAGFPSTLAAYEGAAQFVAGLVTRLSEKKAPDAKLLPPGTLLNVNYPALAADAIKGARWAVLGPDFGYGLGYRDGDAPNTVKLAFGPNETQYAPDSTVDTARFAAGYITLTLLDSSWLAPRGMRVIAAQRIGDLVGP